MKVEAGEVFIAEDGRKFATADECQTYESDVLNRKKKIKFFHVWRSVDTTETGSFMGRTVLAVEHTYPEAAALDYCIKMHGPALQYVQGVSPVAGWKLEAADADMWARALGGDAALAVVWGGSGTKALAVFLSDRRDPPIEGWPLALKIKV